MTKPQKAVEYISNFNSKNTLMQLHLKISRTCIFPKNCHNKTVESDKIHNEFFEKLLMI